ncbi:phenylacetate--CoA ligase family protein [Amycolatopsis lurida]
MHQLTQLRDTISHVVAGSSFYRRHLGPALAGRPVHELDLDSIQRLPFTTKDDLRAHGLDVLSRPVSSAWIFYETTGTTGRTTPCPRDNVDSTLSNTALTVNYADVLARHPRQQIIGVLGPTELHSTGDAFGEVFRNLGQCVVKMWPHSPVVGFPRALEVMGEIGVTALVCTPGMAMSLARAAIERGRRPEKDFDLDFIMVVGELASPALLANIGSIWSTTVYNCMYASQEASIMAAVRGDGKLHTIPLNNFYEVVDPRTGERVDPGESGERVGELVVTHLFQGCKPLVRYRTGDLVRLEPAAVGEAYPSEIMTPLGRTRDVTRIGSEIYPAYALEQAILSDVTGCYGYQIVVDTPDGADTVRVVLEFIDERAAVDFDAAAYRQRLAKVLGLEPSVEVGSLGTIATTGAMVSWKASRMHDKRVADDPERLAALAIAHQRDSARR